MRKTMKLREGKTIRLPKPKPAKKVKEKPND